MSDMKKNYFINSGFTIIYGLKNEELLFIVYKRKIKNDFNHITIHTFICRETHIVRVITI